MSAKQGRLFDEPEENSGEWQAPPNARASDPETSHEAGRKVERSGKAALQRAMVLGRLKKSPGSTFAELARSEALWRLKHPEGRRTGALERLESELSQTFHRRLPDLKKAKLARVGDKRKCAVNGTTKQTWFAIEENQ